MLFLLLWVKRMHEPYENVGTGTVPRIYIIIYI